MANNEETLDILISQTNEGIVFHDNGLIIDANKAAADLVL